MLFISQVELGCQNRSALENRNVTELKVSLSVAICRCDIKRGEKDRFDREDRHLHAAHRTPERRGPAGCTSRREGGRGRYCATAARWFELRGCRGRRALRWIAEGDRFAFWKAEVKCRLVAPDADGFHLDDWGNDVVTRHLAPRGRAIADDEINDGEEPYPPLESKQGATRRRRSINPGLHHHG